KAPRFRSRSSRLYSASTSAMTLSRNVGSTGLDKSARVRVRVRASRRRSGHPDTPVVFSSSLSFFLRLLGTETIPLNLLWDFWDVEWKRTTTCRNLEYNGQVKKST